MTLLRAASLLLFGFVLVPAAGASTRSTREQVDAIESDLRQLQQVVVELQDSQARILEQIAALRGAMALDSPDRRSPADLAARLDSVETDLRIVQENQNDAGHRIAVLSDKVDGVYRRQAQLAAAAAAAAAAAPPPPAAGEAQAATGAPATPAQPPPEVEEEQVSTRGAAAQAASNVETVAAALAANPVADEPLVDPEELYDAARADYGRGSYDLALSGFQEFLERFPKSELADNALYWTGECHDSSGRLEDAMKAFDAVVTQFPDSDKAPDAAYKKGIALLELNRTAEGILQLQSVKDTWPNAPAGRLARTKLQALGLL